MVACVITYIIPVKTTKYKNYASNKFGGKKKKKNEENTDPGTLHSPHSENRT